MDIIKYIFCCKCCRKKKNKIDKNITIKPKNSDYEEYLLFNSDNKDQNLEIKNISELKFNTSDCILKRHCDPKIYYDYDETVDEIGRGTFGVVHKVKSRLFKFERAMKKIEKSLLNNPKNSSEFVNEIKILQKLEHPNIMKIYELYEDDSFFFIVTEFISQGNLLQKIESMTKRDEVIIGLIMFQILSAVAYLHKNNIVHGDLKPENIMISTTNVNGLRQKLSFNSSAIMDLKTLDDLVNDFGESRNSREGNNSNLYLSNMKKINFKNFCHFQIKLIDFGCSKVLSRKNYKYDDTIGTVNYMAPEVALNTYNEKCDLWSCGVIMFVLFTGKFPFEGDTVEDVEKNILDYNFTLEIDEFKEVSEQAKDLIRQLMTYNPNDRISAINSLNHPFFTDNFNKNNIFNEEIDCSGALNNMKNFKKGLLFQQFMNGFISYNLVNEVEIESLRKVFKLIDKNGDGMLSKEEIILGFRDSKIGIIEEDMDEFLKKIDNNYNGMIDFEEFIRACSDKQKLLSEENLKIAFEILDHDKDGSITKEEIKKTFFESSNLSDEVLNEFLNQINKQENDKITYEDFVRVMNELK